MWQQVLPLRPDSLIRNPHHCHPLVPCHMHAVIHSIYYASDYPNHSSQSSALHRLDPMHLHECSYSSYHQAQHLLTGKRNTHSYYLSHQISPDQANSECRVRTQMHSLLVPIRYSQAVSEWGWFRPLNKPVCPQME